LPVVTAEHNHSVQPKCMPETKNTSDQPVLTRGKGENPYPGFVEMAVHDLQAPLRKLSVLADRLANKYKDQVDADVQQYTSRINNCIQEMRVLIDGLKDFGQANFEPLEYSTCNTDHIIKRLLHEVGGHIREKNAVVTVSGLPVIEADKGQLRQLFRIFLENALTFIKQETSPTIDITGRELNEEEKKQLNLMADRNYFKIVIADNGIGFKPEDAENVFKPFVRLLGKSFPGNGLGLAVAKRIADNHQGIIYVEAEENAGARFILILPDKP
jgi:signal transduction histidine kinase